MGPESTAVARGQAGGPWCLCLGAARREERPMERGPQPQGHVSQQVKETGPVQQLGPREGPDVARGFEQTSGHTVWVTQETESTGCPDGGSVLLGTARPLPAWLWDNTPPPGGQDETGYLVPFVAPPSAHPVGPHGGEQGQVVPVGLCQEHRLPRMQGEAGAGVPLLRDSRAQTRWSRLPSGLLPLTGPPPTLCSWGLEPPAQTSAQGSASFLWLL